MHNNGKCETNHFLYVYDYTMCAHITLHIQHHSAHTMYVLFAKYRKNCIQKEAYCTYLHNSTSSIIIILHFKCFNLNTSFCHSDFLTPIFTPSK